MGTRMLPNMRNSRTNVASAINAAAIGSRENSDALESTSSAEAPPTSTGKGAGLWRTAFASRSPASEYGSTDGTTDSHVASRAWKRAVNGPGPATCWPLM